ncbi:unnamed protein product [Porites lobata]|uniref:THD domain-containing protein n=1 Tax=Porites lobata TaxID=104759 RepID=A0ABN8QKV8_9CNID|nr:unnamed protein product [Porites lobata]
MKFLVIIVASVCANLNFYQAVTVSGNHDQNSNKPSAHIEAVSRGELTYQANQLIKDWNANDTNSHLAGGMKYHDGKLTVPTTGRYYIYLQIYYHSTGRIQVRVNGRVRTMIQIPVPDKGVHGTAYAGGIFNLIAGDVITIYSTRNNCKIYMSTFHTYFGAYLIGEKMTNAPNTS